MYIQFYVNLVKTHTHTQTHYIYADNETTNELTKKTAHAHATKTQSS